MAKALIIVDVQNDFVEEGSLAVSGGRALAADLAKYLTAEDGFSAYDTIVTTQDYHIDPGSHFADEPDFVDSWPAHCRAGTPGAELVSVLAEALDRRVDIAVKKGRFEAAYSGFEGLMDGNDDSLVELLQARGVTEVDIVGIAYDYCVAATALDSAKAGFTTRVLEAFSVGINPDRVEAYRTVELPQAGVQVVSDRP